ncbi:hypothetical protein FRB99_001957 [Tulasnella sp. 403]|nr:hypothetical protein FRB99_001957 [Tulasnella sp. 403]
MDGFDSERGSVAPHHEASVSSTGSPVVRPHDPQHDDVLDFISELEDYVERLSSDDLREVMAAHTPTLEEPSPRRSSISVDADDEDDTILGMARNPSLHPAEHVQPASRTTAEDRLLVMRLVEEERSMAIDAEIANYLHNPRNPINFEITFEALVERGFVSAQTLNYLADLDTFLLAAAEGMPAPDEAIQAEPSPESLRSTTNDADLSDDDIERPMTPLDVEIIVDQKGKRISSDIECEDEPSPPDQGEIQAFFVNIPDSKATCGICYSDFRPVHSPRIEVSMPSSSQNAYGVILPCSGQHTYCLDCIATHIRTKIDDAVSDRNGLSSVRCPECPAQDGWEVTDEVAVKVLNGDLLEQWYFQKLLASLTPTLVVTIWSVDAVSSTVTGVAVAGGRIVAADAAIGPMTVPWHL